jgi:hypothetical protein
LAHLVCRTVYPASETQKQKGYQMIEKQLGKLEAPLVAQIRTNIGRIRQGERDLNY